MRMRMGFRSDLDDLNRIIRFTTDADTANFARTMFGNMTQDYETRVQESMKRNTQNAMQYLQFYFMNVRRPQDEIPSNLQMVVHVISSDDDLNAVGPACRISGNSATPTRRCLTSRR